MTKCKGCGTNVRKGKDFCSDCDEDPYFGGGGYREDLAYYRREWNKQYESEIDAAVAQEEEQLLGRK